MVDETFEEEKQIFWKMSIYCSCLLKWMPLDVERVYLFKLSIFPRRAPTHHPPTSHFNKSLNKRFSSSLAPFESISGPHEISCLLVSACQPPTRTHWPYIHSSNNTNNRTLRDIRHFFVVTFKKKRNVISTEMIFFFPIHWPRTN